MKIDINYIKQIAEIMEEKSLAEVLVGEEIVAQVKAGMLYN